MGAMLALALSAPLELSHFSSSEALSGRGFPTIGEAGWVTPRSFIPLLNIYGAGILVLSALYTAVRLWRRVNLAPRMWDTLLIAGGSVVAVGLVGTLNRLGFAGTQSLGELFTLVFIFSDFKLASQARRPETASLQVNSLLPSSGD